jgi:hypothetical protein
MLIGFWHTRKAFRVIRDAYRLLAYRQRAFVSEHNMLNQARLDNFECLTAISELQRGLMVVYYRRVRGNWEGTPESRMIRCCIGRMLAGDTGKETAWDYGLDSDTFEGIDKLKSELSRVKAESNYLHSRLTLYEDVNKYGRE